MITLLSVFLATIFPGRLQPLVASGEALASILLAFFFAAVGIFLPAPPPPPSSYLSSFLLNPRYKVSKHHPSLDFIEAQN